LILVLIFLCKKRFCKSSLTRNDLQNRFTFAHLWMCGKNCILQNMTDKENILSHIRQSVKAIEPESEIILYGSRARGEEKEESDWDVLILVPYPAGIKEEQQFRHKLFEVELQFGQAISTLVKSKNEWEGKFRVTPLYQNIAQEGIAI